MAIRGVGATLPAGGRGNLLNTFRIKWQGDIKKWIFSASAGKFPLRLAIAAITELINRDSGRVFLLPSLSKAYGSDLSLSQVGRELTIEKFQEGTDSGIFKVTAAVTIDGSNKNVSFCLNVAKNPKLNNLHTDICRNLAKARKIDDRYAVRPFFRGLGRVMHEGGEIRLAMFSAEWLEGFVELDMINAAEQQDGLPQDHGMAVMGLRRWVLNEAKRCISLNDAVVDYGLGEQMAVQMVKIFGLYFDPQTSEGIQDWHINNGDFVCRLKADGRFDLKLVTIRKFKPFPVLSLPGAHFRAIALIERLVMQRENSVLQQNSIVPDYENFSVFPFTPTNICRGLKMALVEKFGDEQAREMLIKWLSAYIYVNHKLYQLVPEARRQGKVVQFRQVIFQQEVERFLFEEEKYPPGVVDL